MKIGILTFHSQLNYGGVLQCWALQATLEGLGHEVVVMDRWHNVDNSLLERGYNKYGFLQWVRLWLRSLLGLGDVNCWLRHWRTKKFLGQYIKRTPYHFVAWKDAPKELGVDMLVVGSDQVWHCGDWGDPRVYLLEGAPSLPAIAYAASFGMTAIPPWIFSRCEEVEAEPIYRSGLAKFKAISCRESEGVRLCEELGTKAMHVVDPTLLLTGSEWRRMIGVKDAEGDESEPRNTRNTRKVARRGLKVFCYFLGEDFRKKRPALAEFARQTAAKINVFIDGGFAAPLPKSLATAKEWLSVRQMRICGNVNVCDSAGPMEFLRALAEADAVISDSFHALMFSIVFKKNVRILKPRSEIRKKMFARIEEFARHVDGSLVSDGLDAALASIGNEETVSFDREWIADFRAKSMEWLKRSLEGCERVGASE